MIIEGLATYFLESNTDTDVIMPAKFLKRVQIDGFEPYAFFEKRYSAQTLCEASIEKKDYVFSRVAENPGFPPNFPNSNGAAFLLTWENFGCGSSREHAVFGLKKYKVIIGSAPVGKNAFADIFRDNCRQNLIWTPVLSPQDHAKLAAYIEHKIKNTPITLRLDSQKEEISCADMRFPYSLPKNHLNFLLSALSPLEKAKLEIDQAAKRIDQWNYQHKHRLQLYPSTKDC